MAFPVGAAIAGGASLLGSGLSAGAQGKMNRASRQFSQEQTDAAWGRNQEAWGMQNEYNEGLWAKQNQYNEDVWHKMNSYNEGRWDIENAYNSPAAQMERFKAAGLNPNLIYGQQNSGGAVNAATMQSDTQGKADMAPAQRGEWNPKAPQFDFGGIATAFSDTRMKAAQTNNLEKQGELITAQTANTLAQTALSGTTREGHEISNKHAGFKYEQDYGLREVSAEAARETLRKLSAEATGAEGEYGNTEINALKGRAEERHSMSMKEATQRILNMKTQNKREMTEADLKELDLIYKNIGPDMKDALQRVIGDWFFEGKPDGMKKYR